MAAEQGRRSGKPLLNQLEDERKTSSQQSGLYQSSTLIFGVALMAGLKMSMPLCDVLQLYNNSSAEDPFQPFFSISNSMVALHRHVLPGCAEGLLEE